ncbi:hypothetical protein BJ138DRAFT_1016033 [Hygrophoropsis aurantiaca]|uniref:Uncharacterized protein n=1 Tax=Hygrophoropsis aurantiaca TaxID=72124 RepID=A0ACB8A1N6_9AGAM|nr:hypothetical protein BJ138DRAFT_1016033 [Hygrophoropsis aurantiaca]
MIIGDFSACVMVDGVELKEYGVTVDSPNKITCWIASEEGKKCWSCVREEESLGTVSLDGIRCTGTVIGLGSRGNRDTARRAHFNNSDGIRNFLFSPVQLTDDDSYLDQSLSNNLGEISLAIVLGRRIGFTNRSDDRTLPGNGDKIHERSKKVISHRVGFAESVKCNVPRFVATFQANSMPPLVFVFKYRPLEILQANGIAPQIPAVNPKPHLDVSNDGVEIRDSTNIDASIVALEVFFLFHWQSNYDVANHSSPPRTSSNAFAHKRRQVWELVAKPNESRLKSKPKRRLHSTNTNPSRLGTRKDFSACVMVDGVELKEYGVTIDPADPQNKITCWIASEEGKKFTVQWKCWSRVRKDASSGTVVVDGTRCAGKSIHPGSLGHHDTGRRSYIGTDTSTRDFLFSRVQLTDDDSYLDQSLPKNLGEISLEMTFGRAGSRLVSRQDHALPDKEEKIHERAKKVTSHRVGFAESVRRSHPRSLTKFHQNNMPPLVFVFKYRPLEILQANGIAPRAPVVNPRAPLDDDMEIRDDAELDSNIAVLEVNLRQIHKYDGTDHFSLKEQAQTSSIAKGGKFEYWPPSQTGQD